MRADRCADCVPGARIRGRGVGAHERSVDAELDLAHADVVRGGGSECHAARDRGAGCRCGDRDARRGGVGGGRYGHADARVSGVVRCIVGARLDRMRADRCATASQVPAYGAEESVPTSVPSTRNSTLLTPTLSEAVAASATLPETVAPDAGAVIATLGAVVSRRGRYVDAHARVGRVVGRVVGACLDRVGPGGGRRGVPRAGIRCARVGADKHAVDGELDPGDADVVEADAASATEPETVAPDAGLVSDTVGAVVSAGGGGRELERTRRNRCRPHSTRLVVGGRERVQRSISTTELSGRQSLSTPSWHPVSSSERDATRAP